MENQDTFHIFEWKWKLQRGWKEPDSQDQEKMSDSFQLCPVLSHAVQFFPMSVFSNETHNFCRFFYSLCFMVIFWLFLISSPGKVLSGSFQRCPILSCPVLFNPSVSSLPEGRPVFVRKEDIWEPRVLISPSENVALRRFSSFPPYTPININYYNLIGLNIR